MTLNNCSDGTTLQMLKERNNTLDSLMRTFLKYVQDLAPYKEQVQHFEDAIIETLAIGDSEINHLENMQKFELIRLQNRLDNYKHKY